MKIDSAIIKEKEGEFEIHSVELQDIKNSEVRIKIKGVGICHTDLTARDQLYDVPLPMVLGHEGSGIVDEVGSSVRKVKKGDHVVLTYGSCGTCRPCKEGTPQYCENFYPLNFGGERLQGNENTLQNGQDLHGCFFQQSSFASYAIAHERNVIKVRKEAPIELLGPLGCGIQTGAGSVINSLQPIAGSTIAIFGAGSVGLSAVMAAKICGCKQIIVIDINKKRLELSEELGATKTVNSQEIEDVVSQIKEISEDGVDYAVESTGVPKVLSQAIKSLRQKGSVAVVGAPPMGATAEIDVNDILVFGKKIIGVVEGDSVSEVFIPRLVDFYLKGQFPIDKIVSYFDFDKINQAVEQMEDGTIIKPILKFK